jgi:hypothetical protein
MTTPHIASQSGNGNGHVELQGLAASAHVDGLCCHNPSELKVRLGQEAMARQRRRWEDFMIIAEALDVGRTEIMRDLHTNQPTGKAYERAMGEWLVANGFKEFDKGFRCRLLECLRHREQIERWRALLTDGERFRFNHPDTVLRRWKASTVVPDPNTAPKLSPFAKLKDAHALVIEENHRLQQKIKTADAGDLWKPADRPEDIADVMINTLSLTKAKRTAQEILRRVKERTDAANKGFTASAARADAARQASPHSKQI